LEEGATLFGSREWATLYSNHLQSFQIQGKGEHKIGSFVLFQKNKLGVRYTITAPFASHIGLIAHSDSEKTESSQSFWKTIHQAIASYISTEKDALVEITLSTDHHDSQPYTWEKLSVRPRHTYLIDLEQRQEVMLSGMSPERRKNIKKAQEEGLEVEVCEDPVRFMKMIDMTIERQQIGLNKEILAKILSSECIKKNRSMYICTIAGKDIAAGLLVWDRDRTYYLMGAYDSDNSHEGGGALIIWQAILEAKKRGNSTLDFEGSMIPEVERFFRGFGGKMHTFFSIEKKTWLGHLAKHLKS
jgi:hypothetical protein